MSSLPIILERVDPPVIGLRRVVLRYSKRDVLILDFPEDTKKKSIKDFIHATYPPADKPYAIHYLEFPGAALLVPSNAPYARHYLVASNKNK